MYASRTFPIKCIQVVIPTIQNNSMSLYVHIWLRFINDKTTPRGVYLLSNSTLM
jgi:hypothetical protein